MKQNENEFAKKINGMGGELYLVGGAVRDALLNLTAKDRDYMISGLDLTDIPSEWEVVGKSFPVFLVEIDGEICEVALARSEKKIGAGHKGFKFHTSRQITSEDDLARRDLTINAMAKNCITGKIIDPFGGVNDLAAGIIRHTSPAFAEDPLRVFRAARFAAKFNFSVAEETIELSGKLESETRLLSAERVWLETEKALKTSRPSLFFETLDRCGCLKYWYPEIEALKVPDKHDGTAYRHTMAVIDGGQNALERFCLLCHDFGKALTDRDKHPSHIGHEKLGASPIGSLCDRLRVPNRYREAALVCAAEHMRVKHIPAMKAGKCYKFFSNNKRFAELVIAVSFADSAMREGGKFYQEAVEHFAKINHLRNAANQAEHNVTGKALIANGVLPGKSFGQKLFYKRVQFFKDCR